MMKFKSLDRVRIIKTNSVLDGKTGTITGVSSIFAEIQFYIVTLDNPFEPDPKEYPMKEMKDFGLHWTINMIGSCLEKIEVGEQPC